MSIEPTVRERIVALDVLRGFAVLGILIANIPSFASVDWAGSSSLPKDQPMLDRWIEALSLVFVNGKFRSTLAILFGIGVWLQYQKRSKVEGNWPGGYIKRCLWLGALGLLHGLFVWFGDILFFYAGMAVVTALLAPLSDRILKTIMAVCGLTVFLCCGGFSVFLFLFDQGSMDGDLGAFINEDAIRQAFQQGSYLDQLKIRSVMFGIVVAFESFLGLSMLPLFLLGILFGRSGVLQHPSQYPRTRNWALLIGFGLGLPLNLLGLLSLRGESGVELLPEFVSGPILAVGYLMLVAVVVEKGWGKRMTRLLERVGRVALTSYLTQSLVCTFVFYSWGLGFFGRLSLAEQMLVVPIVWAINVLFAAVWLRRFDIGPFEWLWRSLTEGKRLPLLSRTNRNDPSPVP